MNNDLTNIRKMANFALHARSIANMRGKKAAEAFNTKFKGQVITYNKEDYSIVQAECRDNGHVVVVAAGPRKNDNTFSNKRRVIELKLITDIKAA